MHFSRGRPALVGIVIGLSLFAAPATIAWAAAAGKVKEGQPAPDVNLPATQVEKVLPDQKDAKTLHLKDLEGKKNVVLYFFPKAGTPG
jgi:hypothetical protein